MIACKGELIGWFMCFVLWDANLKLIMASRWPVVNIVLVWLRQPLFLCWSSVHNSSLPPLGINHQLVTTTEESGEFYWTLQSFAFAIRFRVLPRRCTILKLRQLNDRLTRIKTSIQCCNLQFRFFGIILQMQIWRKRLFQIIQCPPKILIAEKAIAKGLLWFLIPPYFQFSPTKYKKIVQHNFLEINWREWRLHQEKILPSWGKWLCLAVYFGQTNTNTNTQGTCGHISLTGGWLPASHFSETTNFESTFSTFTMVLSLEKLDLFNKCHTSKYNISSMGRN